MNTLEDHHLNRTGGRTQIPTLKTLGVDWAAKCLGEAALGCVAAMLLLVCQRRCIQILGPGADSSTAGSSVFLVGVGAGSLAWRCWRRNHSSLAKELSITESCHSGVRGNAKLCTRHLPILRSVVHNVSGAQFLLQFVILGTMCAAVLGNRLSPTLNDVAVAMWPLRSSMLMDGLTCVLVAATVAFVPAFGLGAIQLMMVTVSPTLVRRPFQNAWLVGVHFLFGLMVGYVVASRWLIPTWGTLPTIAIALTLLLSIFAVPTVRNLQLESLSLISLAAAGLILTALGGGLGGGYSYGDPMSLTSDWEPQFFKVGAFADVRVVRNASNRLLQLDGIEIGGTGAEYQSELASALFPRLLRPSAKRALVLGFATGTSCGASLMFPNTEVTCVEEEPAVVSAAEAFGDMNLLPTKSAAFKMLYQNPRTVLASAPARYDLILVNYNEARLPETGKLLTKQFYSDAKSRLTPGGIVAHRLKLDSFAPEGLASVARTILMAFPHCGLIRVSDTDAILLGSNEALLQSPGTIRAAQFMVDSLPLVGKDLIGSLGRGNIASLLFTHLWLNEAGLRRLAQRDLETRCIGDWNCEIASFHDRNSKRAREDAGSASRLVYDCARLADFKTNFHLCGCGNQDVALCHEIGSVLEANGQLAEALHMSDWGLYLDNNQPDLLADRLIWSMEEDPKIINDTVSRIAQCSVATASRVGVALSRRKRYAQAAAVFEHLLQLRPFSATLLHNLAEDYEGLGNLQRAKECIEYASSLDPANKNSIQTNGRSR